jgi:hypothetical protein
VKPLPGATCKRRWGRVTEDRACTLSAPRFVCRVARVRGRIGAPTSIPIGSTKLWGDGDRDSSASAPPRGAGHLARAGDGAAPRPPHRRGRGKARPGRRLLLTSMLDPKAFPAAEIIALYHERLKLELGYREVKTRMLERFEAIRSRKPGGSGAGALGARRARVQLRPPRNGRIAVDAGVAPNRISFVMVLNRIRDGWSWCVHKEPGRDPPSLARPARECRPVCPAATSLDGASQGQGSSR